LAASTKLLNVEPDELHTTERAVGLESCLYTDVLVLKH